MTTKTEQPGSQLAAAVCAVMAEAGVVTVTGKMTEGRKYSYASEEDVMGTLQPLAAKHGLCILPSKILSVREVDYQTSNGYAMRRVRIKQEFKLLHISGEFEILTMIQEGADSGDKAVGKVLTALKKYCWRQTFGIVTGEDPDKHSSDEQQARGSYNPNAAQRPQGGANQGQQGNYTAPAPSAPPAGSQAANSGDPRSITVVAGQGVYTLTGLYINQSSKYAQDGSPLLYATFTLQAKTGGPVKASQFNGYKDSLIALGFPPTVEAGKQNLVANTHPLVWANLIAKGEYLNVEGLGPLAGVAEPQPDDAPGWDAEDLGPPLDMEDLTPGN